MREMSKSRRRMGILIATGLLFSGISLWVGYRQMRLRRLFEEASGVAPYFQGTGQAQDATRRIGSFHGDEADNMLFQIASGDTRLVWPSIQAQAVEELKLRNDPRVSEFVAGLLQPNTLIDTRKAAAQALQSMACDRICTTFVLHYLERIYSGEPNYEDRARESLGGGLDESVKADLTTEQQAIYALLFGKLMSNPQLTNVVLKDVYGLGTEAPAVFALDLAVRANDKSACQALGNSRRLLSEVPKDSFDAPRDKLDLAIASLQCPPN
jgi:hypothetical protein